MNRRGFPDGHHRLGARGGKSILEDTGMDATVRLLAALGVIVDDIKVGVSDSASARIGDGNATLDDCWE
jgi:hypothetical protein